MSGAMMPMPPGGAPSPPMPPAPGSDAPDAGDNVVVTICQNDDGTYTVYAGDEPEEAEGGDMSGDDANAMGSAGDQPAGQPAKSMGEALKLAMDIMQQGAAKGPAGSPEDQFSAGFGAGAPPPMGGKGPMMGGM